MKNTLKVKQWLKEKKNLPQFEFITPTRVKRIKDGKIYQIGQTGYAEEIVADYTIGDFGSNNIDVHLKVQRESKGARFNSNYTWNINWL